MFTYTTYLAQAKSQLGYTEKDITLARPSTTYAAYKNGEVQFFNSRKEALSYSPNIEPIKDEETTKYNREVHKKVNAMQLKAEELMMQDAYEEYSELSPTVIKNLFEIAPNFTCISSKDSEMEIVQQLVELIKTVKGML
jgi:hypothetical protein